MGMIIYFHAASDETIGALQADPSRVFALLDEDPEQATAADLPLDRDRGEGRVIDLDKSWHAIHYLLNGTAWGGEPPLNLMLSQGCQIGDIDVGYGPARAFTSEETADYADALAAITGEALMSRYDAAAMLREDIYPQIWDEDDIGSYIIPYFERMKRFMAEAKQAGLGVVVALR
jgi:hypothetical protein